jgi:hypothetical protein
MEPHEIRPQFTLGQRRLTLFEIQFMYITYIPTNLVILTGFLVIS